MPLSAWIAGAITAELLSPAGLVSIAVILFTPGRARFLMVPLCATAMAAMHVWGRHNVARRIGIAPPELADFLIALSLAAVGLLVIALMAFAVARLRSRSPTPEQPPHQPSAPPAWANLPGLSAQTVLFFLFFPPVGLVMMMIGCPARRLEATDYVLALLVPLFGHVKFMSC